MFAQRLANAARTVARPAAKRGMALAQNGTKVTPTWNEQWNKADVYPIVFMVTLASTFSVYTIGKNAMSHEDVLWNKQNKAVGIATFYAHRYPGTESSEMNKPGARSAH